VLQSVVFFFCNIQFCATRKGVQQAASTLVKEAKFIMDAQHKQRLQQAANSLRDSKLRGKAVFSYIFTITIAITITFIL